MGTLGYSADDIGSFLGSFNREVRWSIGKSQSVMGQ